MTSSRAHRRAARRGSAAWSQSMLVLGDELPPSKAELSKTSRGTQRRSSKKATGGTPTQRSAVPEQRRDASPSSRTGRPDARSKTANPAPGSVSSAPLTRRTTALSASESAKAAASRAAAGTRSPKHTLESRKELHARKLARAREVREAARLAKLVKSAKPTKKQLKKARQKLAAQDARLASTRPLPPAPLSSSIPIAPSSAGRTVARDVHGTVGDVVIATVGTQTVHAVIERADSTHCLLVWAKGRTLKRVVIKWSGLRAVVLPRATHPQGLRIPPGAPVIAETPNGRCYGTLVRYLPSGEARIRPDANPQTELPVHLTRIRLSEALLSGPSPLLPAELRATKLRTDVPPGKPSPDAVGARPYNAWLAADTDSRSGTHAGPPPDVAVHRPGSVGSGAQQAGRRGIPAPLPPAPVRGSAPADLYPPGTTVEVRTADGFRRGTVRRTVSAAEVVVAFESAAETVTRTVKRSRIREATAAAR